MKVHEEGMEVDVKFANLDNNILIQLSKEI